MLWICCFFALFTVICAILWAVQRSRNGTVETAEPEAEKRKKAFRAVMNDPALRAPGYRPLDY